MKKLLVFLVMLLLPKVGNAIELIGDLYYNLDLNSHTAEVTRNLANKYTASSFVIPEAITFNGNSYCVTGIASYAFYSCSNLNAVTIPSSVKTIGSAAFDGCALSAVVIPEGVTSIESYAFERCTKLTSITIPNSVENIGKDAFYSTVWYDNQPDGLVYAGKVAYKYKGTMPTNTGIVLRSGTLGIAGACFYNCSSLASVSIPKSVKMIGDYAFYNCNNLSSVSIPYGVNSIGNDAFFRCNGLTSITIPGSVKSIDNQAFYRCDELTSVTILDGVESIGDYVFSGCNKLASITIPNSVTTIGRDVFEHTAWLNSQPDEVVYVGKIAYKYNGWMPNNTSIVLKEGTTTIHDELFSRCYGLISVTIPNSVTTIGNNAFYGCSSLVSAFIPKNVTKIGGGVFNRCTSMESIVVDPENNYYDSRNNCNAIIETASNTLLTGCKSTVIPNGVTQLGDDAFIGCVGLTSVIIPNSVTRIGSGTFQGCTGLTSIVIPNSVTSISNEKSGGFFLEGCTSLETIIVEQGNPIYDSRDNCNAIIETSTNKLIAGCKNTFIPKSVTSIGNEAFDSCTGIQDFFCYAKDVPDANGSSFYGWNLASLVLHVPATSVDTYKATAPWSNFGTIVPIEEAAEKEAYAVLSADSTSLTFYYDGQKVTRQGRLFGAEEFCNGGNPWKPYITGPSPNLHSGPTNVLATVVFDESFALYDGVNSTAEWFSGCSNLKTIQGLQNLNVSNVTDMSYMFSGCGSLTELDLKSFNTSAVTNMACMFFGCTSLEKLNVSSFDTKEVTDMHNMFGGYSSSTYINPPRIYNSGCRSLASLDVSSFNTSNVVNMGGMFAGCTNLQTLDLSNFNTEKVTSMSSMFEGCESLISIDLSSFNTSNVTTMQSMFGGYSSAYYSTPGCKSLIELDLSHFNTSNVTDMSYMFYGCNSVENIDVSNFNTEKVENMRSMFSFCSNVTTLDLSSFKTVYKTEEVDESRRVVVPSVHPSYGMFGGCAKLTTIYVSSYWDVNWFDDNCMFMGCLSLVGGDGTVYDPSKYGSDMAYAGDGGYLTLKEEDDLQRYLNSLTDTEDSFVDGVYTRQFKNDNWQALYVPFTLDYSSWADRFEVAYISNFWQYDDNGDGTIDRQLLVATIVESGKLRGNLPYLIRSKSKTGGTLTIVPSSVADYHITVFSLELPSCVCTFTGNYSHLTSLKSASRYRLAGGSLSIPDSDDEVLLPYRWYMTIDNATTQDVRLCIVDGETTGIDNLAPLTIHRSPSASTQRPWAFDLSGRRVDADAKSLPKGVYIIDGRKYVVK